MILMQVTIKSFASIREILNNNTITLEFNEPPSIQQIIQRLITQYPPLKPLLITQQNTINPLFQFIYNEQTIPHDQLDTYLISHDETLVILPPIGGG